MSDVIKKEENAVEKVTEKTVMEYIKTFVTTQLTEREIKQFIQVAVACNLNPLKKEIYCIPFGIGPNRKLQILTGYEVYIKRAERLRIKLNGWNVKTEGSVKDNNLKAIITIYRKDWEHPFTHEVYFNEYNQNNTIWRNKPITMLVKVVTAQGFRLSFPLDFEDLPYIEEEIRESDFRDVTPDKSKDEQALRQISEKPESKFDHKLNELDNIIKDVDVFNPVESFYEILKLAQSKVELIEKDDKEKLKYFAKFAKQDEAAKSRYPKDFYDRDKKYLDGLKPKMEEPEIIDDDDSIPDFGFSELSKEINSEGKEMLGDKELPKGVI